MRESTMERLLGFSPTELEGQGPFRAFREIGDGPEEILRAETLRGLCEQLTGALLDGEVPDFDDAVVAEMPVLEGEPIEVRALLYELSDDMGMERTTSSEGLAYLGPVLEERADLRLVVAWEAVAPRQDFAVGIFRVEAEASAPEGQGAATSSP